MLETDTYAEYLLSMKETFSNSRAEEIINDEDSVDEYSEMVWFGFFV